MDLQKLLALKKFSEDQTFISMSLAKEVISTEAQEKNLVFSPLSIHVVLGVIAAGSTGQARNEVLGYLRSRSSQEFNSWLSEIVTILFADASSIGGPRLSCANAIWVAQRFTLKPEFKEVVGNAYKTVLDQVEFQNRNEVDEALENVNQWVKNETNGLIKELLSPGSVNALTRLIFGNAVYFKGAWSREFDKHRTRDEKFFLLNGTSIQAPFMTISIGIRKCACAFNGFKVLRLPYKQGQDKRQFSMYIFLPDSMDGLPALVEKVTTKPGFIEHHLPYEMDYLKEFLIPKFKISFQFEASNVLKGLGIESPFHGGLTEMVDETLFVSSFSHKSFIEVNERGTEAAAVTYSLIGGGSNDQFKDCMNFVADHPFLFIIREDTTGMLLFVGRVLNPLVE